MCNIRKSPRPHTALYATFLISSCVTSGAKSPFRAVFLPHLSDREMKAQKVGAEIALGEGKPKIEQKEGVEIALRAQIQEKAQKVGA